MSNLYIGLMSGTSVDNIDAALVDFSHQQAKLMAHHSLAIPADITKALREFNTPGNNEIDTMGQLDIVVGKLFAEAVLALLKQTDIKPSQIIAIGSHGQTIRHRPNFPTPFTLQIGDPNTIATLTGITTVADFRRKDMALGGQGAPLLPAFHAAFMRSNHINRIVLNLGGIANITVLPTDVTQQVTGFDTGPANGLLDLWIQKNKNLPYDKNGEWAKQGKVIENLLEQFLADPYFKKLPPKSTGKEYFNLAWLENYLSLNKYDAASIQRTLLELTAQSIFAAIQNYTQLTAGEIVVCGGGAHNQFLLERLQTLASHFKVISSQTLGIDPNWVEAMGFAWFATQTLERKPSNLPSVTGARELAVLGGVYYS